MGLTSSYIFSIERNVTDVTRIFVHSAHFKIQTPKVQEVGQKETKLIEDFIQREIFRLQIVLTHSTYNSSTVRGGHDCRTFFCVTGTGSIFIHTGDGDGVPAIHINIECTAVPMHAAISSCKRVDGTSFITTLCLKEGYIYILATKTSLTIYRQETYLVESIQYVTSHHFWQKPWIKT